MAVINKYTWADGVFTDSVGSDDLTENGTVPIANTNPAGNISAYTVGVFSDTNYLSNAFAAWITALGISSEGTMELGIMFQDGIGAVQKVSFGGAETALTTNRYFSFISETTINMCVPTGAGFASPGNQAFAAVRGRPYSILFNWDATNWSLHVHDYLTGVKTTLVNNAAHGITPDFSSMDQGAIGRASWAGGQAFLHQLTHVILHDSREDTITVTSRKSVISNLMWGTSHIVGSTQSTTNDGIRTAFRNTIETDDNFIMSFTGPVENGTVDFSPRHSGQVSPGGKMSNIVLRMKTDIEASIGEADSTGLWLWVALQGVHDLVAGTTEIAYKASINDAVTKRNTEAANSPLFFVTDVISPNFDTSTINTWMKDEVNLIIAGGELNIFLIDITIVSPSIGIDNTHMNDAGYITAGNYMASQALSLVSTNSTAFDGHGRRRR